MNQDQTSIFVRKAVGGEPDAVEWLVSHFQPLVESQVRIRLRGHGTAQDIEDVTSDVWLITLSNLDNLRPRANRLAPVLITFLSTTVLQSCNNFLRRQARQCATRTGTAAGRTDDAPPPGLSQLATDSIGVVTRAVRRDLASAVRDCFDQLSDDKRDVLTLRLMEQRSNQEIAELMGIPANSVAVRYRRALDQLRSVLPPGVFEDICSAVG